MRYRKYSALLKKNQANSLLPFFPSFTTPKTYRSLDSLFCFSKEKKRQVYGFLECDSRQELNALQVTFAPQKDKRHSFSSPKAEVW
jgi:hypothetical protein